jgi:hypothetical protein
MSRGRPWSLDEIERLKALYPHAPTKRIAEQLGRSTTAIYGKANLLGLNKAQEYLDSPDACRLRRGDNVGAACRFQKGHVPANKGLRRPGFAPGKMAETQFKPGQKCHNWKPIGSERLTDDGYLQRKMTDTGYPPRDWIGVHILLWEQHHGPVPAGHCVAFRNGNRTDIRIDNLELITRRERMLRNTVHNLPKSLVEVVQLRGVLQRKINRLERNARGQ